MQKSIEELCCEFVEDVKKDWLTLEIRYHGSQAKKDLMKRSVKNKNTLWEIGNFVSKRTSDSTDGTEQDIKTALVRLINDIMLMMKVDQLTVFSTWAMHANDF